MRDRLGLQPSRDQHSLLIDHFAMRILCTAASALILHFGLLFVDFNVGRSSIGASSYGPALHEKTLTTCIGGHVPLEPTITRIRSSVATFTSMKADRGPRRTWIACANYGSEDKVRMI